MNINFPITIQANVNLSEVKMVFDVVDERSHIIKSFHGMSGLEGAILFKAKAETEYALANAMLLEITEAQDLVDEVQEREQDKDGKGEQDQ